ncbi:MAG: hypothetical protein COA79_26205 [Planctomycetota bacterium]|nr:MAG: hypothetical protein COA79_26205 [Planctomycetota bacterium]
MHLKYKLVLFILVTMFSLSADDSDDFLKKAGELSAEANNKKERVIVGKDGWLFFSGELRHLSVGKFWGKEAEKVSKASRKKYADPLPAILEFKKQLDSVGVELLLVPVPAKSMIKADKISTNTKIKLIRLDKHHQSFYKLLQEKGVAVLDLYELLSKDGSYCKTDTHWSPEACASVAKLIYDKYSKKYWQLKSSKKKMTLKKGTLKIKGDLLKESSKEKEELSLNWVYEGEKPVKQNRKSPVLLIGDSHTLVFSVGGDMHTRNAGLADHLAYQFKNGIDVVGVRGSGVTVPRIDLARRKDNLGGKRLVIWCFSVRQFTESTNGWMTKIPLIRK